MKKYVGITITIVLLQFLIAILLSITFLNEIVFAMLIVSVICSVIAYFTFSEGDPHSHWENVSLHTYGMVEGNLHSPEQDKSNVKINPYALASVLFLFISIGTAFYSYNIFS